MSDFAERQPLNSATRAVLVNRLPEPHQQPQFNRNLAVVIGIDAYTGGIPRLTTAVNDATRLAELLRDAHGYETILLTEPATGQPVTRAGLSALFTEELPARMGDDDRLLVYFAGHGVALDGDDGPRGYLVPQDARPGDSASMLAMTDLHAWLTALPCRHMLAILDCCFAGAFRWSATRHIGALPDVIYRERYDRYLRSPAWQVLTSAAYDQKALDVLNGKAIGVRESDGKGHSPFAQALIDALEKGEADLVPKGQGDGVITATELYLYLREQVEVQAEEQVSHEQTPQLWPLNKHRKGEFIFLAPGHPLNLPAAPDLTDELNPYRGLKSYDQQHAPLFFGREDEIKELVALVEQRPFLAVLGASGTGKSSLVKAGVLPRLEVRSDDFNRPAPAEATEVATTNDGYCVLPPMRPTDRPVQALAALLHAGLDPDPVGFRNPQGLVDGDDALAQVIARWAAAHPNQRLVLTIDQFEELATLCRDDAERDRFLRLLASAVEQQPAAFRLIITLRTDFEPQFTQEGSPLANLWQSARLAEPTARYIVPPMDIEDLRQVIEGPAAVRVLYFDPPELVDDLIKEVIQTPGALPLLSFTLSELYVKYVQSGRDDRALAGADYKALGGVVGSLRNRATEEYDRLPDDAHRLTMQRVMLRMVATEGGDLARRRVALSELAYPTDDENARVQTVLDRLVDARLLVRGTSDNPDGTKGEAYVEPAHDALVLAWDKLLRWKKEAEEYLPLQRRLAQAASEWSKAKPEAKTGLLWDDDPRLPQVEETLWPTNGEQKGPRGRLRWARQVMAPKTDAPADTKWLNGAELAFVQTSMTRRAGALRRIIGITAAVMVVLAGLTIIAGYQAKRATAERDNAVQSQRATERTLAQMLVAQSNVAERDGLPQTRLVMALSATSAYSPTLAEATEVLRGAVGSMGGIGLNDDEVAGGSMAFSPDSRWLAIGRDDNTVSMWALDNLDAGPTNLSDQPKDDKGSVSAVNAVAFAPDNHLMVSANYDTLLLWDIANPSAKPTVLLDNINAWDDPVSIFSPNSRLLAMADRTTIRLWNVKETVATPVVVADPECLGQCLLRHLAFAPDSRWIAAGGNDAFLWDTENPQSEPIWLDGHAVSDLAFSSDGRWLAVAGGPEIKVWDMQDLEVEPLILYRDGDVTTLTFSADSRWLAAGSTAGTTHIWTIGDSFVQWAELSSKSNDAAADTSALAFSSDSRWIAVLNEDDNVVRIWDVRNPGAQPAELKSHDGSIEDLAFSLDGRWLATASVDGSAHLWRVPGAQGLEMLYQKGVSDFDFSYDGRWLASTDGSIVRIWNLQDSLDQPTRLPIEDRVISLAFSPKDPWLATGDENGNLRLWDVENLAAPVAVVNGQGLSTNTTVFSANGKWLAIGRSTRTGEDIELWDVHGLITGANGPIHEWESSWCDPVFSPDDRWLAACPNFKDTTAWWDLNNLGSDPIVLSRRNSSAITFSPDGRWFAAGHESVRLWGTENPNAEPTGLPSSTTDSSDPFNDLAFSPDGRWLAASQLNNFIRLWDTQNITYEPATLTLPGHGLEVAFSPDGHWLAIGGVDTPIWLWDMFDPNSQARLLHSGGKNHADDFLPEGRWLTHRSVIGASSLQSLSFESLVEAACQIIGYNFDLRVWNRWNSRGSFLDKFECS